MYSNKDYGCAVSELYGHLQQPAIQKFQEYSSELARLDKYIDDQKANIPAFSAMRRLSLDINEPDKRLNTPLDVLSLSMALRLRANQPKAYRHLLSDTGNSEADLAQLLDYAAGGCPKMLEWAIAWAELFYLHAIS